MARDAVLVPTQCKATGVLYRAHTSLSYMHSLIHVKLMNGRKGIKSTIQTNQHKSSPPPCVNMAILSSGWLRMLCLYLPSAKQLVFLIEPTLLSYMHFLILVKLLNGRKGIKSTIQTNQHKSHPPPLC